MFGRIVLGFDGTERGYDALALGELLARAGGGSFVPTSVVPRQPPFDAQTREYVRAARARTHEVLESARHALPDDVGSESQWISAGSSRHALLGSVSAKLMRTCPAPLLVVPRGGHVG